LCIITDTPKLSLYNHENCCGERKGGTGKNQRGSEFSALITDHRLPVPTVFLDCDVEAPNAALFFTGDQREELVDVLFPTHRPVRCDGCGQCVDICHYHALTVTPKRLVFFPELCHHAVGAMVCPQGAIDEKPHRLGEITSGSIGSMHFMQGEMDIGNSSPVAIINSMMNRLEQFQHESPTDPICIIDAPPGILSGGRQSA
jgi:MinD superfamily P-loop ATPase